MIGKIVLLNRRHGGLYSNLQRFFTRMNYTHCTFTVDMMGIESILSSNEKVVIIPLHRYFEEDQTDIEIYEVNASEKFKEDAVKKLYELYAEEWYGFAQLLWFIFRWFMEVIFRKDVRKWNNPFKSGVICSELVYYYIEELAVLYPELNEELDKYTPDTTCAGDIANIIKKYPQIFVKI